MIEEVSRFSVPNQLMMSETGKKQLNCFKTVWGCGATLEDNHARGTFPQPYLTCSSSQLEENGAAAETRGGSPSCSKCNKSASHLAPRYNPEALSALGGGSRKEQQQQQQQREKKKTLQDFCIFFSVVALWWHGRLSHSGRPILSIEHTGRHLVAPKSL